MNPITFIRACKLLGESPYFDKDYYSNRYHIPRWLCIPYDFTIGRRKENNPSQFFDAHQYYIDNPDVKAAGAHALYHYLVFGQKERRPINDDISFFGCKYYYMFDSPWYAAKYMGKSERRKQLPLEHYTTLGWKKRYLPFENFDLDRFYRENPQCDTEPLMYWFENQLTTSYFKRPVYGEEGFTINQMRALQYLYKYQQIDWLKKQAFCRNLNKLTLIFARSDTDAYSDFTLLQKTFKNLQGQTGENDAVFLTVLPGRKEFFGEDLLPENVRLVSYPYLAAYFKTRQLEIILMPDCVDDFAEYIQANDDDFIRFSDKVQITIVNSTHFERNVNILYAVFGKENVKAKFVQNTSINNVPYLGFFDEKWYKEINKEELEFRKMDASDHYIRIGWREKRKPFEYFDIERFYEDNPDCDIEPLHYWYINKIPKMYFTKSSVPTTDLPQRAGPALQALYKNIQNQTIEAVLPYRNSCKKLIVQIVSPEDAISGGIMSFCGIYRLSKELKDIHDRDVIAVTCPGDTTHSGFTMFKNDMPVYRYEQIQTRLNDVDDVLVMLPELYAEYYYNYLKDHPEDMILNVEKRHLNILNQRVELMPKPEIITKLKRFFDQVTQTVAHYSYCSQEERERFGIPTHLLIPPIFKEFKPRPYEEKEDIFLYSYDEQPWKKSILDAVQSAYPNMKLKMIWNISFDEYMELIGRAKWCMTFGEGLDGYFSEPYEAGSISFAVWNDIYFTSIYKDLPSIFPSPEYAINHIADKMKELDNKEAYEETIKEVRRVHDIEYAGKRTPKDQLRDFFNGKYDFP